MLIALSPEPIGRGITKVDKAKSKKGRVVILVCDTSSRPVLHFFQILSKYSKDIPITDRTRNQFKKTKQEVHGPWIAHLSDIATADMQMLCNIFAILASQLMERSSFKQFLILKKNIYGMTINGA